MASSSHAQLEEIVRPTVEGLGFEFWGLEYHSQSGNALLRVYIEAEAGISVDDCAEVSRQLSVVLDVEDPISSEYRLEVSSPGAARVFFRYEQYQRFVGERVKVKLRQAFDGRKTFTGVLTATANEELTIFVDGHEYHLPYEWVDSGRVFPDYGA